MRLNQIFEYDEYDPRDDQFDNKVQITLCDPTDESGETCVDAILLLNLYIEPTEYEGGYLFYRGGFNIEGVEFDKTVTFMGQTYQAGTPFPDQLIPYVWDLYEHNMVQPGMDITDMTNAFEEYLRKKIEDRVKVPSKHYPASWR